MEAKDEVNAKGEETKITSVIKEKIKDPRRVAQGKKLGAISREAKERKAKERAMQAQLEEGEDRRHQETNENFLNVSYAIIPIIRIAFVGYYFLYLRNSTEKENREDREEPKKIESKQKPNLEKL